MLASLNFSCTKRLLYSSQQKKSYAVVTCNKFEGKSNSPVTFWARCPSGLSSRKYPDSPDPEKKYAYMLYFML